MEEISGDATVISGVLADTERPQAACVWPSSSHPWSPPHLQYDRTSWLQLQDPRGIENLKDWVWVVGEVGFVEDQQGLHVVENEAELLWALS